MRARFIRPGKSRGYICVGIDTGGTVSVYNVSERDYARAGSPLAGDLLDEESAAVISDSDMRYRAMKKALSILSYGDNSARSLLRKLTESGIRRETAEETVREMMRLGYIDEHRQLKRLVMNEVRLRLSGPAKLFAKLMAKGYSRSAIESAMDELTASGELDFDEVRARLIETRLPPDADGEQIKKLLYKNGY